MQTLAFRKTINEKSNKKAEAKTSVEFFGLFVRYRIFFS